MFPGIEKPLKRRTVDKVCRYVEENIGELGGTLSDRLARLDQAYYVQELLGGIMDRAGCSSLDFDRFPQSPRQTLLPDAIKPAFILNLVSGMPMPDDSFVWDDGY